VWVPLFRRNLSEKELGQFMMLLQMLESMCLSPPEDDRQHQCKESNGQFSCKSVSQNLNIGGEGPKLFYLRLYSHIFRTRFAFWMASCLG
jgi:hypothetical protein